MGSRQGPSAKLTVDVESIALDYTAVREAEDEDGDAYGKQDHTRNDPTDAERVHLSWGEKAERILDGPRPNCAEDGTQREDEQCGYAHRCPGRSRREELRSDAGQWRMGSRRAGVRNILF